MTARVRIADTLVDVRKMNVRTESGLVPVNKAFVRTETGLKQAYSRSTLTLTNTDAQNSDYFPVTATLRLKADGTLQASGNPDSTWVTPPDGSPFEVLATQISGDPITGTFGTWQRVDVDRAWSVSAPFSATTKGGVFTLSLRYVGTTTVVLTVTVNIFAQYLYDTGEL